MFDDGKDFLGLVPNSVIAPPYMESWTEHSENPHKTTQHLRHPWISLRYPLTPPPTPPRHLQTSQDAYRYQQTPTEVNRHQQTLQAILKQHMAVSVVVSWCLLASVGVCWHLVLSVCLGGVCGGVRGYLSDVHRCLRWSDVLWGISECSVHVRWSNHAIWKQPQKIIPIIKHNTRHQNIKMSICELDKNGWVLQNISF